MWNPSSEVWNGSYAADAVAPATIVVLGIGNALLSDDGVGLHLLRRLEHGDAAPPWVRYLDGGTVGLALAPLIEDAAGLVVLDALRLRAEPGTVQVYEGPAMDVLVDRRHQTPHEVGWSDLLSALRLQGRLPERRALVGIEPVSMDWGTEPTPRVAAALEDAAARVRALIAAWRPDGSPSPQASPWRGQPVSSTACEPKGVS